MTILVENHPGYRVITLNRPSRLNALTVDLAAALQSALSEAESDDTCRAVLLTGAGRGFCAGQDLTAIVDQPAAEIGQLLDQYNPLIRQMRALPLPIVCAVNGVAAGAGANLALACDFVIAAHSATFVQAFARIGLIPDCGGTWLLPRLVGAARARALSMLADPVSAEQAADWGLIWRALPDHELIPEAHALAARLANQATIALGLTKQALNAAETHGLDAQLDLERDLQATAAATPDHAEGLRAFLAKRPARFTGRKS